MACTHNWMLLTYLRISKGIHVNCCLNIWENQPSGLNCTLWGSVYTTSHSAPLLNSDWIKDTECRHSFFGFIWLGCCRKKKTTKKKPWAFVCIIWHIKLYFKGNFPQMRYNYNYANPHTKKSLHVMQKEGKTDRKKDLHHPNKLFHFTFILPAVNRQKDL